MHLTAGMQLIPSDTYTRRVLSRLDPQGLRPGTTADHDCLLQHFSLSRWGDATFNLRSPIELGSQITRYNTAGQSAPGGRPGQITESQPILFRNSLGCTTPSAMLELGS